MQTQSSCQSALRLAKYLMFLVLFFLLSSPSLTKSQTIDPNAKAFSAGMNVIIRRSDYRDLTELDWKLDALLEKLYELNVTAVSINWYIYTENVRSNKLSAGVDTPEIEAIVLFAKKAKDQGFEVMIRPILNERVLMSANKNDWRGTIRPKNVNAWFLSYSKLLLNYADIAQTTQADSLVVATELTSMEKHTDQWRQLVAAIRERYDGQLTYSSNQGVSEEFPWEILDFIGVDAFFKLDTPENDASTEVIILALQREVGRIVQAANNLGKPLVFTEIGSTSQKNAHRRTWIWDHRTPVDLENQRRFYFASCAVWKHQLQGLYWWAVSSNLWLIEKPAEDRGFSPLGKPAENEIKKCFE